MTLQHHDFEAQTRAEALLLANAWLAGNGLAARLVNMESIDRDGRSLRLWYEVKDVQGEACSLPLQSQPSENALRPEKLFVQAAANRCQLVRTMSGATPQVRVLPTQFVLDGAVIELHGPATPVYSFWLGLNHRRLFWIANMHCDSPRAEAVYQWCFSGAAKVGWSTSFQPFDNGTSVWATCLSADDLFGSAVDQLSAGGEFWATDIAMMAQSWLRTSEREGISCSRTPPAPL